MLQIYYRRIVSSTLKFSNAHSFNLNKDLSLSRITVKCLHTSSNPENRIVQGNASIAQRVLEKQIHGASSFSTSSRAFRKEHQCPPKCKEKKIEVKPSKCLAVKCVATPHYSEISQVKPPDICEKKPEELCLPDPCCPEYPLCVIDEKPPDSPKIVIVGSGVAGLSAAQMLAKAGLTNYLVIEGSSRPGGRISSRWFGDTVIELGPEGERANAWHQPVLQFAIEEGFLQQPLAKSDPSFGLLSGESTTLAASCFTYGKFKTIMKDAFSIWPNAKKKDRSMILSIIGLRMKQALKKMPLEIQTPTVKVMYGLLCSFFCSYQDCSSFIKNNDFGAFITLPGFGISIPLGTLGTLSPLLSAVPNEKIHFNRHVRSIRYGTVTSTQKPRALVSTMDGSVYSADYVVVTSSLGTIKSQASSLFSPLLPATKVNAVDSIEYVHVDKIFLYFEKPLWTWRSCYINKSWSPEEMRSRPNWTKGITKVEEVPNSKHILCIWLEGPEVVHFERQSEEEVLAALSEFLCDILNDPKTPAPVKMVRSMWSTNSLFMGAYSRSSPSSTSIDEKMLAAFESPLPSTSDPLPPIVFFGGEGTSIGHSATVSGARSSGIREVSKIIQLTPSPKKSSFCEDQRYFANLCSNK